MGIILCKWTIAFLLNWFHPFFVGVTEVQHNKSEKTLEISIKLFIDDFERGLSGEFKKPVDLSHPKDSVLTNREVFQYIQKNLKLKVDGKPVQLEYVGYEKEREAAWCYIQVSGVPDVHQLEVSNTLLYNVLEQQIHILHVTVNGKRQSSKVMNPDRAITMRF